MSNITDSANLDFFENYETKVTHHICKILRAMFLVLPALWLASVAGLFRMTSDFFMVVVPIGFALSVLPTLLLKLKVPEKVAKYTAVVSVGFFVGMISTNNAVNLNAAYMLMPLFAAMYFDKKFAFKMAVLGFVIMAATVYMRAPEMVAMEIRDRTAMEWYISRLTGYSIEYVAVTAMIIALAGRAKGLLETLSDAEKISLASKELSSVLAVLSRAIADSVQNNKNVVQSADITLEKCNQNMAQVLRSIDEIKIQIGNEPEQERDAAATQSNGTLIETAFGSMREIRDALFRVGDSVASLVKNTAEIAVFSNTIRSIARQTTILSINAAIEAARAGEHGKGFVAVAQNVGELAIQSAAATEQITSCINKINAEVDTVGNAVQSNVSLVAEGMEQINTAREETLSKMVQMSRITKELTEDSLTAVGDIKQFAVLQSEAVKSIEEVFVQVEGLTDSLVQ